MRHCGAQVRERSKRDVRKRRSVRSPGASPFLSPFLPCMTGQQPLPLTSASAPRAALRWTCACASFLLLFFSCAEHWCSVSFRASAVALHCRCSHGDLREGALRGLVRCGCVRCTSRVWWLPGQRRVSPFACLPACRRLRAASAEVRCEVLKRRKAGTATHAGDTAYTLRHGCRAPPSCVRPCLLFLCFLFLQ